MAMVVGWTRPESLVAPIFQAYTKKNQDMYCKYKVRGSHFTVYQKKIIRWAHLQDLEIHVSSKKKVK
jgi:hypothetical protein